MIRPLCALLGHPEWRETTIPEVPGTFGQQYMSKGGIIPAEIEASIMHGRSFRCVRCKVGRVEPPAEKPEWIWK